MKDSGAVAETPLHVQQIFGHRLLHLLAGRQVGHSLQPKSDGLSPERVAVSLRPKDFVLEDIQVAVSTSIGLLVVSVSSLQSSKFISGGLEEETLSHGLESDGIAESPP